MLLFLFLRVCRAFSSEMLITRDERTAFTPASQAQPQVDPRDAQSPGVNSYPPEKRLAPFGPRATMFRKHSKTIVRSLEVSTPILKKMKNNLKGFVIP